MSFIKSTNNNKTDYYSHDNVLMPQDISCGDIIETHHGEKSALILGFVFDTQRQVIQTIHTAEITREAAISAKRLVHFIASSAKREGDVSGVDLPAHIYTDRTQFKDLAGSQKRIERIGRTSPSYFEKILTALQKDNKAALPRLPDASIYIPSLQYLTDVEPSTVPAGIMPYGQIDDYGRLLLVRELSDPARNISGDAVHTQYIEELRSRQREGYLNYLRGRRRAQEDAKLEMSIRQGRTLAPKLDVPTQLVARFDAANISVLEEDPIQPDKRQIVTIHNEVGSASGDLRHAFHSRPAAHKIMLPKHLWQGRYLMINVANLDGENPVEAGKIVQRPCALWKLYADKNTRQIVGLELHPATRSQSENYQFKMHVSPLKTYSKKESLLVADCIIRVPLTAEYVHPDASISFFELTSEKAKEFIAIKAAMEEQNAPQQIIGLQTIPHHWVEAALDPTPSLQQLQKRARQQRVQADGVLQDKLREALAHLSPR